MSTFMAVTKFKENVTMEEIQALIPTEQAQAKKLEAEGKITSIKISMPKRTTFIEVVAETEEGALESIQSLPMAALWNIEIFPTTPPAGPSK